MKAVHPAFLIFLFIFCLSAYSVEARQTIEGRVLDQQTEEPLIGVNISVEGTSTGTTTDLEGYFEFTLPAEANRILVSYVGYIKQQINVNQNQEFLNILMEPDNVALNEVQVIGFDSNKKLQETAASVGLITIKDLDRSNPVNVLSSLNTVPGVKMDQDNFGDSRISIRGAGIRAPFGIRNIKLYVNEIPLTEADGFSKMDGLDESTVGRVEVIKGPASSLYGAGTGGVVNFQLKKARYNQNNIEATGMAGSYGLARLSSTYRSGNENFNAAISLGSKNYDGYRDHSNDVRNFFTASLQLYPSKKQTLSLLAMRSRQETQIPGTLNEAQVEQDPTQATDANVAQQAARYQTWVRLGFAHTYEFSDQIKNTTSLYTSTYDMYHPLPFGIIKQPYQSYGGRTRFTFTPEMDVLPTSVIVGAEFINGIINSQYFANNGGEQGSMFLDQELNNTQYSFFLQSETSITPKTSLEAGLSYNEVKFKYRNLLDNSVSGTTNFNGELMPRIALVHVFNDALALRGGVSFGFSPPTTTEIIAADGSVNSDIQAEKGVNYEIGARGNFFGQHLNYDITLFSFQMQDQLVPQSISPNVTIFNNAGETSKVGIETALSYFWSDPISFVRTFRPFVSYTYSDFEFDEFVIRDAGGQTVNDYSGNEVTGISPHVLSTGFDITSAPGFYLNATYFYNGEAPIVDDNTVYNDAYSLLNTKIGFEKEIASFLTLDINAGVNNLLDETYTSQVSLNATSFGGGPAPFYNPAPKRNVYGMLAITYTF